MIFNRATYYIGNTPKWLTYSAVSMGVIAAIRKVATTILEVTPTWPNEFNTGNNLVVKQFTQDDSELSALVDKWSNTAESKFREIYPDIDLSFREDGICSLDSILTNSVEKQDESLMDVNNICKRIKSYVDHRGKYSGDRTRLWNFVLGCYKEDQIVGLAVCKEEHNRHYLEGIMVHPDYIQTSTNPTPRLKGIGSALMHTIIGRALNKNLPLQLDAIPQADRFYSQKFHMEFTGPSSFLKRYCLTSHRFVKEYGSSLNFQEILKTALPNRLLRFAYLWRNLAMQVDTFFRSISTPFVALGKG